MLAELAYTAPVKNMTPRLSRTLDVARINAIANHPDVRPWLGAGRGDWDAAPLVNHLSNVCAFGPSGGFIAAWQQPGVYQVHSLFLPDRAPQETFEAMREGLRLMFEETDAVELLTCVPQENRGAHGLALAAHFERRFSRPLGWISADGTPGRADYYGLTLERWALHDDLCCEEGVIFHALLAAAKRDRGLPDTLHADDKAHEHLAGLVVRLAQAGQAVKAVEAYNRWARFAGYQSMRLLRERPPIADTGDAIVTIERGEVQVLSCR